MSPRRSSRARSSANPAPPASHTASSTSSTTLKNSRTAQRSESVEENTGPEEDDATSTTDPIMPRRSRRNGGEADPRDPTSSQVMKPEEDDVDGEQELEDAEAGEVTRCICGRQEYPGAPASLIAKVGESLFDLLNKDIGDFFLACDNCGIWQHGGCVGLPDENAAPEEYWCELCKPKLHKIEKISNKNGHSEKRSQYLGRLTKKKPDQGEGSRSPSASSGDVKKKDKKKNNSMSESTKRRATMNSRGAYDEDEALRRAIEESNRELGTLGKRTREDGDESRQALKRQRTGSVSSGSKRSISPFATDDGSTTHPTSKSKQSLRGAAAKNNKEREAREHAKEQQLAARTEAANKRKARSERRRLDDSPPPSPSISPSKAAAAAAASIQRSRETADTPPISHKATATKSKPGSRNARAPRRLGRNQYTRDRDLAHLNGGDGSDTPAPGDINGLNGRASPTNGTSGGTNGVASSGGMNGESGRSSKAKTHPARTSLNEMKRRVAAIAEFVGQMQMQGVRRGDGGNGSGSEKGTPVGNGNTGPTTTGVAGLVKAVQAATEAVQQQQQQQQQHEDGGSNGMVVVADGDGDSSGGVETRLKFKEDGEFGGLGSGDMMEALMGELVAWQGVFGVYSR